MNNFVIDTPDNFWQNGYNMCRETKKKLLQAIKGVNVEDEDVSLYADGGWD